MELKKTLIKYVSDPLLQLKWGDRAVFRHARDLEASQFLGPEGIRAIQLSRLQHLLAHAYRRCPFYRERFQSIGLRPDDVRSLGDLQSVPVLEKRDIQGGFERMVPVGWPREDLYLDHTGGSTGTPISFYSNRGRRCWGKAAVRRHNGWAGLEVGDRVAYVWGAPRDFPSQAWRSRLIGALSGQQIFLDTGSLDETKMMSFHGSLVRFRPRIIQAYARSLALFARFLRERGLSPPRPNGIVTSAEVLDPADREVIEDVFGCPVFNRYGCREVGVIASECPARQGMHLAAEGLLVEIVQGNDHVGPGESGAILVTDLLNLGMPLIRYRIGDMGVWEPGPCPCGRGLPRLREVSGRVTDFLVGADGRLVSGVFLATYVVARRTSLGQVQILQEEPGRVRYRIKPGPSFRGPDDLDYIRIETARYLGEGTIVDCEFADDLGPEPSGKYIFSRSSVALSYLSNRTNTRELSHG